MLCKVHNESDPSLNLVGIIRRIPTGGGEEFSKRGLSNLPLGSVGGGLPQIKSPYIPPVWWKPNQREARSRLLKLYTCTP